jgi:ATP-dependent Clp protease ATP-binding subunit ClpC
MFERFSKPARRVVVLAQDHARGLDHNYIGTEHILLGLIAEGESPAAQVLLELGVTVEVVRGEIETIIGHGQQTPAGHIPFTPRAKKVLELSLREALQFGQNYVGTGHILLAIETEAAGVAVQILQARGVSPQTIRDQIRERFATDPGPDAGLPDVGARAEQFGETIAAPPPGEWHIIMPLIREIEERLTAIERHLGVAGETGEAEVVGENASEEPPEDSAATD